MPFTSRTRAVVVLASALLLLSALTWTPGAQAAPGSDARAAAHRAKAEKLLAQVQHALAPKKLPSRTLGNPLPRTDVGLLMHRLQVAKGALSAKGQATADLATSRPIPASTGCVAATQPGGLLTPAVDWAAAHSQHFCVHYIVGGTRGATPYWVQATLKVLEHVYAAEIGSTNLGFRKPLNDGDGKYDVFLDEIGNNGYYGFCTTDTASSTSTAWCELDNDFAESEFGAPPGNSLRVTAAHEFFHAIQFAYDANDMTWFLEGTAVWMEDQVYPTINDYLQYLKYSQITQSTVPIDTTGTYERYGAVIFWKYLSEGYHDVDIVHRIWNAAGVSEGSRNALQATIDVLRAKHVNFAQAFARFSVWNTLPPNTYADRKLWPKPVAWGTANLNTRTKDTGDQTITLDHLSSANVVLIPSTALPTSTRLRITVSAPSGIVGQVRIQVRRTDGSVGYTTMTLSAAGNGSSLIAFTGKSMASVRVTLANVTTTGDNQAFKFRAVEVS